MNRNPIKICILNPNATQSMTDEMVASAQSSLGGLAKVEGLTNRLGPAAIQGPKDAEDCLSGLFGLFETARSQGADGIIVGCFDDTGLGELRSLGTVPVVGLGEAGCMAGSLASSRFSVVTTLAVSVPVIAENVLNMGLSARCNGVYPSGVAVLEVSSAEYSVPRVTNTIDQLLQVDPHQSIVLGCGGMTAIASQISPSSPAVIIDPVVAAVQMCLAVVNASSRGT